MIDHKNKILFVHVPKTGGSSIESSFGCRKDHLSISELKYYQKGEKKYKTFSFIRNPWDRIVSSFCYASRPNPMRATKENVKLFEKFVFDSKLETQKLERKIPKNHKIFRIENRTETDSQLRWIKNTKGNVEFDFLGRYENLIEDFTLMQRKFKISLPKLPHINKTERDHYSCYYEGREIIDFVYKMYEEEINLFDYSFEKNVTTL